MFKKLILNINKVVEKKVKYVIIYEEEDYDIL